MLTERLAIETLHKILQDAEKRLPPGFPSPMDEIEQVLNMP